MDENTQADIVNMSAYRRGYGSFFKGEEKPYTFSVAQNLVLTRRARLLEHVGPEDRKLRFLTEQFTGQGIHLVDSYDPETSSFRTRGYICIEASCPYKPNTYAAKEWQRGFNAAYYKNLERKPKKHAGNPRTHASGRSKSRHTGTSPHPR